MARFVPSAHHIAVPGFVYGGLLASLVDCHSMATAAAAFCEPSATGVGAAPRFVTGALKINYLKPTPLGVELELRAHVVEKSERKAVVQCSVFAAGVITVTGETVAVRIPAAMQSLG